MIYETILLFPHKTLTRYNQMYISCQTCIIQKALSKLETTIVCRRNKSTYLSTTRPAMLPNHQQKHCLTMKHQGLQPKAEAEAAAAAPI